MKTNPYPFLILAVVIAGLAVAVGIDRYQKSDSGTEISFCGAIVQIDNRKGYDVVQVDYNGEVIHIWVGEVRLFDVEKIRGFYAEQRLDGIIVGKGGCKSWR